MVFNGYLEKYTKDHLHLKRYPVQSMDVVVNLDHKVLCKKKSVFLSNPLKKHKFIEKPNDALQVEGFNVTHCKNDADTRIVQNTVEQGETAETHVVLVGDNTR